MRSFHQLAILALPLLGTVASQEPVSSPTKSGFEALYANANEAFQDLLNALPEESLHAALNSLAHFRDGIFESDRNGVERVHELNPPLATKLIVAAVQDLKKRQQPLPTNGTIPTSASQSQAPPTSQAPPQSSEAQPPSSAVLVPVQVSTTDSQGRTTVQTNDVLSAPTASVVVPVTRTNAQGQTQVTSETKPAVVYTATNAQGSAFPTTSPVDFAPTPGQVLTRTDARGSTFLTTYTPGGGKVSSVVLITTTGADGQPSVITSYTYVDPAQATATGEAGATGGNSARPGLQSGVAARNGGYDAAVLGGAMGGLMALFV